MGIPTGFNYPKMVTGTGVNGNLVPLVYPPGHAQQFAYVILANLAAEQAYTNNGVNPLSTVSSGTGGSWENRHHT